MGSANTLSLRQPWIETPLIESLALSRAAGCKVLLKLENLQPGGSFKSRGIGNLILTHIAHHELNGTTKPLHFFSSSGGNAGLACVTAARTLGYAVSVVVPMSTKAFMIAKLKAAGATDVIQIGASWQYADEHLQQIILPAMEARGEEQGVYVPPFDHPAIWQGHATMIEEMHRQLPHLTNGSNEPPSAIICSVGGGGLLNGVIEGLDAVSWNPSVHVLATETRGAHSLAHSLTAGKLSTLPGITSIATSLGAVRVAPKAYENASQRPNVRSVVLEDGEAAMGTVRFSEDERMLIEVSCGVSVAVIYEGRLKKILPGLTEESVVVLVVCGGTYVTPELLVEYREMYAK